MYELWYSLQTPEDYIVRDVSTNLGYHIALEDISSWDGLGWQWTPNIPNRRDTIKLFEFDSLSTFEERHPELFI